MENPVNKCYRIDRDRYDERKKEEKKKKKNEITVQNRSRLNEGFHDKIPSVEYEIQNSLVSRIGNLLHIALRYTQNTPIDTNNINRRQLPADISPFQCFLFCEKILTFPL